MISSAEDPRDLLWFLLMDHPGMLKLCPSSVRFNYLFLFFGGGGGWFQTSNNPIDGAFLLMKQSTKVADAKPFVEVWVHPSPS